MENKSYFINQQEKDFFLARFGAELTFVDDDPVLARMYEKRNERLNKNTLTKFVHKLTNYSLFKRR